MNASRVAAAFLWFYNHYISQVLTSVTMIEYADVEVFEPASVDARGIGLGGFRFVELISLRWFVLVFVILCYNGKQTKS